MLYLDPLGVLLVEGADVEGVGGVHLSSGRNEGRSVLGEEGRRGDKERRREGAGRRRGKETQKWEFRKQTCFNDRNNDDEAQPS